MPSTVLVAMSGGVDSAVAAYLLKNQGFEVIGVTMHLWSGSGDNGQKCCGQDAIDDARRVAGQLDIPHYVLNYRDEFEQKVVQYFCREYLAGCTPNPCIACNQTMKFDALLNKAFAMGAEAVATGHYARIGHNQKTNTHALFTGVDHTKDQSYALYFMDQFQLGHVRFPLGGFTKKSVRDIARQARLPVADKAESQEICFLHGRYSAFIEKHLGITGRDGPIKNTDGHILGYHKGIHRYTVGQRKGLNVAMGYPLYVTRIDPDSHTVWVGEEAELLTSTLYAHDVHSIGTPFTEPTRVLAKVRYTGPKSPARAVFLPDNRMRLDFDTLQSAITPGQAVVIYQKDQVLGGGIIDRQRPAPTG